ncbi:hypothetical protein H0H93_007799 [Arthromyces matolae]|nr:hypothetical protein H0H93_007799 [Arthromyces matolae]
MVKPPFNKEKQGPTFGKPGNAPRPPGIHNDRPKNDGHSDKCFNCGHGGHFAKDCPHPRTGQRAHIRAAHTMIQSDHENDEQGDALSRVSDDEDARSVQSSRAEDMDVDEEGDEYVTVDVYDNDYYTRDDESEHLVAMTDYPVEETIPQDEPAQVRMRQVQLKKAKGKLSRPKYRKEDKDCLITYVDVEGNPAWTLWDSGSTTTGMTPTFLNVHGIPVQELTEPLVLQLGTVGSRAKVLFGTKVKVTTEGSSSHEYVDVANFDRYDMIIGTPYMRKHNVVLDFVRNEVIVNGKAIPAQRVKLDDTDARVRRQRTTEKRREEQH